MMDDALMEATARVIDVLESLGAPYLIGGSLASAMHGVARTTLDSDLVVDLQPEHVAAFIKQLQDEFYLSPPAIVDAVASRSSFNVIHLSSAHKVDIFLAKDRPFDRSQFARAIRQALDENGQRTAYFASPEDTILAKLERYRLGGEQSERQWQDLLGVVAVQGERLDWQYMREMAATLALGDLLERLAEQSRG